MYVVNEMPTKLRRLSTAVDPVVYEALAAYSARSRRSISNLLAMIIEQALISTGDLAAPITKPETRGGPRRGAGRKPKTEATETNINTDEGEST